MRAYQDLRQPVVFCLLLTIFLFLLPLTSSAQKPPEIAAMQEKLKRGEQLTPEESKQYDDYIKKLSDNLDKAMDKLKNIKPKSVDISKPVNLPADETLPKLNPVAHYNDAHPPTESEYLALVKKYNDASGGEIAEIKPKLSETLAQIKTANGISNFGMVTLMNAAPDRDKTAAAFFAVTTGAAKEPKNGTIANNFGVLLKNSQNYEDSLKVLLYAEKILQLNALTQTNLGWTIGYLGDFFTAKAKFQKAINLDAYDLKAYEGMGLLFRVEGNIPEASKYLRMSLKLGFSGVAANNLSLVEGKVDGLIAADAEHVDEDSTGGVKISDVLQFPYADGQISNGSSSGKLELARAPEFFSVSLKRIADGNMKNEFLRYDELKKAEFKTANDALYEAQQQLDEFPPAPVREGNAVVYPRNYEPEVFALLDLEHIFARRYLVRLQKLGKRFQNEIHLPVVDKFFAAQKQFISEAQQCNHDNSCEKAADAKFCNLKLENIKSVNGSFQTLWTKYVQAQREDLKSYYDFAAPWLREIKDAKLNKFMNQRREFFIKASDPIEELGIWGPYQVDVGNNWSDKCGDPHYHEEPPPPDIYSAKKLKVYPEPYGACHVPQYRYGGGVGLFSAMTEATCDSLKVEFSYNGGYLGAERKFGNTENDDVTTYRTGYNLKSVFLESDISKASVGVKGGVYLSTRNGQVVDYGVEAAGKIDSQIGSTKVDKNDEKNGEIDFGSLKNPALKLESVQISLESGPRSPGNPAVKFNSVVGH